MSMLKILVVEDDDSLLNLYRIVLEKQGYETLLAHHGEEAWNIMEKKHIDLIITDVLMPVMDGYQFVRSVRDIYPEMPILMITAKDDFASKSIGFTLGTDDYMTKPVNMEEMILRIRALLRRSNIIFTKKLTVHETLLDYDAMTVSRKDNTIMLTPKEFQLLYKLLSYPNKIFTRKQLMDDIWGLESQSDTQTIDVHINRLRRHFENNPDFEIITIRGLGYKAVISV